MIACRWVFMWLQYCLRQPPIGIQQSLFLFCTHTSASISVGPIPGSRIPGLGGMNVRSTLTLLQKRSQLTFSVTGYERTEFSPFAPALGGCSPFRCCQCARGKWWFEFTSLCTQECTFLYRRSQMWSMPPTHLGRMLFCSCFRV